MANKKHSPKKTGKTRRTDEQIFLDKLTGLYDGTPIGNSTLLKELGWKDDRYWRVQQRLRNRSIEVGKGKGGSVRPMKSKAASALSVFVSYSHLDEPLKVRLVSHLEPLRRLGLIETWHDRKLTAGGDWAGEIDDHLSSADLFLALVSIDFINSKYCYDVELEKALDQHATGETIVIPVILRPCLWHSTPLAKLQALPRDGKAVTSWSDQDEALTSVAEAIKETAEQRIGTT